MSDVEVGTTMPGLRPSRPPILLVVVAALVGAAVGIIMSRAVSADDSRGRTASHGPSAHVVPIHRRRPHRPTRRELDVHGRKGLGWVIPFPHRRADSSTCPYEEKRK